ncbi:hypothetical protein [Glutamicibacter nicotianae]|uniref:hypothetical protein n=1 Tax=Glutamicibacter nicotianae TaxID=37929 RepID=UPI0025557910|nr:hypothetical protein [Glutamicibacter nicotianae]WIV44522.1 hypothetical protein QQS42_02560 [Glutamicibacter nicotianae]
MSTCTTPDCENPTDLYLCGQCVSDLQQWIDQIPLLVENLPAVVYRISQTKPIGSMRSNGGDADLSPINLDALQLQTNLQMVDREASSYAPMEDAAKQAWLIVEWVQKADLLVNGPEPEWVNHREVRERIENQAPPMPTRQLIPWLRKNAKISIKGKDIRNWAARGKLQPVERVGQPTYWPHEVLAVHRETKGE